MIDWLGGFVFLAVGAGLLFAVEKYRHVLERKRHQLFLQDLEQLGKAQARMAREIISDAQEPPELPGDEWKNG